MIFSKLFKTKANWQHKDSTVRIAAISNELSTEDNESIQIIRMLSRNDESELVRRTAYIKLASLEDWNTALTLDKSHSLREQAQKELFSLLTANDEKSPSKQEKLSFIDTCQISLLDQWLKQEKDDDIALKLLQAINKPAQWQSLFGQTSNTAVQQFIITNTAEIQLLEKLLKKAKDKSIAASISKKIEQLEEAKQKPIKTYKQSQLILSKLLALKDKKEYEVVIEKRNDLTKEWNAINNDFKCLDEKDSITLGEKYQNINEQLDKIFIVQKEKYEQDCIAKQLANDKMLAQNKLNEQLSTFSKSLSTAVFENSAINEDELRNQIETFTDSVKQSLLNEKEQLALLEKAQLQLNKLNNLPQIAESVTTATHLISRISQLQTPTALDELVEKSALFNQWNQEWKDVESISQGSLPESIVVAKNEITKQWKLALQPLQKEQKQLFSQAQKKTFELKRLFEQGKYNASFGVYKRFKTMFDKLSPSQQFKLQRDYDFISEKINELSDWEHYIATPRKQELLQQITALVEQPMDNPNDQADKVKSYRKVWNSLGHADEEIDKQLNDEFNVACENAFAPCRLFYAEQEKIRQQHLVVRNKLIEDAKQLSRSSESNVLDLKQLDTDLNKLQQLWRDAGDVDRKVYRSLNEEFLKTTKPIKQIVRDFHDSNAKAKEALIKKVSNELTKENVFESIEVVKNIQNEWKSIGFAGPKLENKLWNEFRVANDKIFSKREALKAAEKVEVNERIEKVEHVIEDMKNQIDTLDDKSELQKLQSAIVQLNDEQRTIKPVIKKVMQAIEKLEKEVSNKLNKLREQEEISQWINLFNVMELLANDSIKSSELESNDSYLALSSTWQKKMLEVQKLDSAKQRDSKTIELEILAGIESPKEFEEQRREIQVKLMQEKMTSGEHIDLKKALLDWIVLGAISTSDAALIQRIKPIFIK